MDSEVGDATEVVVVRFVLVWDEWKSQSLHKLHTWKEGRREGEREVKWKRKNMMRVDYV